MKTEYIEVPVYEGALAPKVTATETTAGVVITIFDKDGTHTALVPKGPQGEIGQTGPTGETGPQGPQGLQGETGATGAQGPQGQPGAQGQKGDTGAAFAITWTAPSYEALINDTEHCEVGQFAVIASTVEDPHNAELYVMTEEIGEHGFYKYLTDMSGATGLQGPQGLPGQDGAPGTPGATGATGPMGPTGRGISKMEIITRENTQFFQIKYTDGTSEIILPSYLPAVTAADVGKVLAVDENGHWIAARIV